MSLYFVYSIAENRKSKKAGSDWEGDIVNAINLDLAQIERGEQITWFSDPHTARKLFQNSTGIYDVEIVATSRGTAPVRAEFAGSVAYADKTGLHAVS